MAFSVSRRQFLRSSSVTGGLVLAGCMSAPKAPKPLPPPPPVRVNPPAVVTPPPVAAAPAPAMSTSSITASNALPSIVDTATRLTQQQAAALRAGGVKTVFRYYSQLPPSIPGKDLEPEEAKIILGEGLQLAVIFQHYNNCYRTFENAWGKEDAEQALRMADAIKQPEGSAIYFGVDGDWPYKPLRDPIITYFEDVKKAFAGKGYQVGAYSNGCLLNALRQQGLAQYFWLSGSTGHSGTQAFYNANWWTLYQNALDITPNGLGFGIDTSIINPAKGGYFGQFDAQGARTATHSDADIRKVFSSRRFLGITTELKAAADADSATITTLSKTTNSIPNLKVLELKSGWARVATQEGATAGVKPPTEGWLPITVLAPMDKFPGDSSDYGLCGSPTSPSDTAKYVNCGPATSRNRT